MKIIRTLTGMVLLLCGLTVAACAESKLIGEWVSEVRTRGGLGEMIQFQPGGKCLHSYGAIVPFKYRRDKDQLILTYEDKKTQSHRLVERRNEIEISDFNGSTTPVVMSRVSPAGSTSLTGKWSYPHYVGKQAFMKFQLDGSAWLTVPFETREGTYEDRNQQLTMNIGKGEKKYGFEITMQKLILMSPETQERIVYIQIGK